MRLSVGYYICNESCWDLSMFDAKAIVCIDRQDEIFTYELGTDSHDDWVNLIFTEKRLNNGALQLNFNVREDYKTHYSEEELTSMQQMYIHDDDFIKRISMRTCTFLKHEVIEWLEDYIKPDYQHMFAKGWCISAEQNRMNSTQHFNIFFARIADAKKFIKQWSVHKKPTMYVNNNAGIHRRLDLKTNKLFDVGTYK